MKNVTLILLAATAIGAVSMGSATAMPFNNLSAAPGESQVQNVRIVCDRYQRCYNTNRGYRSARPYYAPRYDNYGGPAYGYAAPGYGYAAPGYGYYGAPRVGVGIGPFGFGFGMW
jgi:hypothetical protein